MPIRRQYLLRIVMIFLALFIFTPLFIIVLWSFASRWEWPNLLPSSFTIRGIEQLLSMNADFVPILGTSVMLSLIVALFSTVIGLLTARAVSLYNFPGKKLLMFSTILPIIVPSLVFGMGIHIVFIRCGLNNTILGVIITHIVCSLPYTINILADLTDTLGDGYEVQAQLLGCSPFRAFLIVSLPLLLPGILSAFCMAYILSFSQYFLTLLIGGGTVKTLSVVMVPFISGGDRTLAFSYALLFITSVLVVVIFFELLINQCLRKGK